MDSIKLAWIYIIYITIFTRTQVYHSKVSQSVFRMSTYLSLPDTTLPGSNPNLTNRISSSRRRSTILGNNRSTWSQLRLVWLIWLWNLLFIMSVLWVKYIILVLLHNQLILTRKGIICYASAFIIYILFIYISFYLMVKYCYMQGQHYS